MGLTYRLFLGETAPTPRSHTIENTLHTVEGVNNRLAAATPEIVAPRLLAEAVWVNPHKQGTPEARRESLIQCMEATWIAIFNRVKAIWPQGFLSTPEIRAAEIEIERVQVLVFSGKSKIADFRKTAEVWEQVCRKTMSGLMH
jgi:hypothetical protein